MSNFIEIPSYLSSGSKSQTVSATSCTDCEVLCTGCMGSGCESSCTSGCTSSCTASCTSSECGDCQVVCTGCEGCETGQGLPQLPTPTLNTSTTIKTSNSIQITINTVEGATRYYARINGTNEQNSASKTFIFTGLLPNTQYFIEIKVYGAGYSSSEWGGYYATTSGAWEWWYPKTSGTNFNLSANEWLAFCERINDVRIANGLMAYSFATSAEYIAKDKPFSAWLWLQAANAINELNTGVAAACLNVKSARASMGDDSIIYPWYFENLKTALNKAIK